MNYSKLTKKEIIEGINKKEIYLINLPDRLKDDEDVVLAAVKINGYLLFHGADRLKDNKDIVLIAVKNNGSALKYASNRLENDKDLLEILEKTDITMWNKEYRQWYNERMEVLANIRRSEEKALMNSLITLNNNQNKKLKF